VTFEVHRDPNRVNKVKQRSAKSQDQRTVDDTGNSFDQLVGTEALPEETRHVLANFCTAHQIWWARGDLNPHVLSNTGT